MMDRGAVRGRPLEQPSLRCGFREVFVLDANGFATGSQMMRHTTQRPGVDMRLRQMTTRRATYQRKPVMWLCEVPAQSAPRGYYRASVMPG